MWTTSSTNPVWTGSAWSYRGRKYRSLRKLKVEAKQLEQQLVDIMAEEIRKEIDREILASLSGLEDDLI